MMDTVNSSSYIRFQHVTKQFDEADRPRRVLDDLNAVIARGEFVAVVGRSGSGKSTLLNLLAGLDRPTSGQVWIETACISRLPDRERTLFRREHVGFVFQFFNLIPTLTVMENVLLTAELSGWNENKAKTRGRHLLDGVGLLDRAGVFPDRLSGGEQQRIAIARALCADPEVILADEPTGNLDAETGSQVLDLLVRLARQDGKTLIMVTHSVEVANQADRILRLEHGRLLEATDGNGSGPFAERVSYRGAV